MSEERLQEIKDSISLQYKVQEANDLHNFNIFTDEEQELVNEIERLNNIINRTTKYVESLSSSGRDCDIYEDIKQEILKELKGSDKE